MPKLDSMELIKAIREKDQLLGYLGDVELLKYGKIGWFILHFILILTIFMAGYYMGRVTLK